MPIRKTRLEKLEHLLPKEKLRIQDLSAEEIDKLPEIHHMLLASVESGNAKPFDLPGLTESDKKIVAFIKQSVEEIIEDETLEEISF